MPKKDYMSVFFKEREDAENVSNLDTAQIIWRPARSLKSNAANFYDVSQIDDLVESIREFGIMSPLGISVDGVVFSGHRRLAADLYLLEETGDAKYENVPCIERQFTDPLEEKLALLDSNSTARILTPYELMEQAKQYDALLVEAKRQGRTYSGRRRDLVAKKMNLSPAKLGRLSAIDKKLNAEWMKIFRDGRISESVAYEISKLEADGQEEFFRYACVLSDDIDNLMLCEVQDFAEKWEESLREVTEKTESAALNSEQKHASDFQPESIPESESPAVDQKTQTLEEQKHEETLDKWRKMAEEQEAAEAQESAQEQEPEQNPVSCGKALDQLDGMLAAVPNVGGESSPYAYICQRFKLLREEMDFTRKQMADFLGWFQGTYSAVENGDACSLDRLCDAAKKLGVSVDWLVGFSDNRTGGISIRNGRDRLTHERCNGIKSGYWSPAKKDELIQRLGEYEDAEFGRWRR